jgi:hypothetical protein
VRSRLTVLIEVPEGIEALLDRDAEGNWPRAHSLARVVDDPHVHPTVGARIEELASALASRAADAFAGRQMGRVVSMHLTPRLAAQLRALHRAQTGLEHAWWEPRRLSLEDRDPQERVLLGVRPLGQAWKHVGRKKVKIRPKQRRTLPVSVRFPPDLFEEVTAYAERAGADRTHVIVECVRQTLDPDREWKQEWRRRGGE